MPIFKINKLNLDSIKEIPLSLEKDLQKITEVNLETVFGLKFVSTEFALHNLRIDTLAFDEENKSFVIIEYKRGRSFSVVDQGFAYLSLMLNNKSDFILEYNEKMKNNLNRQDVDWSQTKILFLANSFTTYQQNAINFRDLPIELWEFKKYDNKTILYNQLKAMDSKESINTISRDETVKSVSREVKKYSIDDHFHEGWDNSREIFDEIRERILSIDSRIEENPVQQYIGYQINRKNIIELITRRSKIILGLLRVRPQDIKDPEGKTVYQKGSMKYYGKHISNVDIQSVEDIDYAVSLVKQVYGKFFK
jgi:predicted transport protein